VKSDLTTSDSAGREVVPKMTAEEVARAVGVMARKVLRGQAIVGILLATMFGIYSYVYLDEGAARAVGGSGAMACLFGAMVALNIGDRIMRRRPLHAVLAYVVLAILGAALVGVSYLAFEHGLGAAWSPFLAAAYVGVLAVTSWRLSR